MIITTLVRRDSASAKYLWTSTPETQTCISMSVLLTYHLRKWSRRVDRFLGNLSGLSEEQAPCEKRHTVELFFPKYSGGLSFLHEELHNHCIDCYFQTFVLLTELGHGTFRQFKSLLFPLSRVCGEIANIPAIFTTIGGAAFVILTNIGKTWDRSWRLFRRQSSQTGRRSHFEACKKILMWQAVVCWREASTCTNVLPNHTNTR